MEEEKIGFRITVEQGNNSARLECDNVVTEELTTIIKMYGGRQCNVWVIPVANQQMLQEKLRQKNQNCTFEVRNGQVSFNAPILKLTVKNKAEIDVFTFGLESSMDDYVWISTKLKLHYHLDDKIYKNHKSVQQTEILPEKRYVPLSFYQSCLAQLKIRHPNDVFEETKSLKKQMQEYTTIPVPNPESISCYSIKSAYYNQLLSHQRACITKGVKLNGKILIADEAGLGKTFSALALATVFSHAFPLLIVCPKWMRNHWEKEIKERLQISSIDKVSDSSQVLKNCKVTIISYLQSKLIDKLKKNYQICIVDESQNLKNGSEVARLCQKIFDQCEYKIFLSGAPVMSRPSELITQLTFICNQKINGFMVFTENEKNDISDVLDPINSKDCHEYLQKYYMARTSKKKCMEILPDFNRFVVQIPIDENFKNNVSKNSLEAYKQLGRAKIMGIQTILTELLVEGEKVLFFAFHKQVIYAVEQLCQELYMKYITIDGTKIEQERNDAIEKFQKDQQIRIAIVSFKTGSTGISLTAATSIVFGEMYFSDQSMMMQAEGRAYRIGQKQILDCYYLIGDCKQDKEMFNEMKKNYFEFSEFLNGAEEDFEAIELTLEEFSKMKRHLPKQRQPKQLMEKIPEQQKMMTRSALKRQLNTIFEQYKNRTYLTQEIKPITIKKTIKKKKEVGQRQKKEK